MWRIIATWPFGLYAAEAGANLLRHGGTALDAVEAGVRAVEAGAYTDTVGLSGKPNSLGEVELDAAIMDGQTLRFGAVAAVRRFLHPVSIARKVMEASTHAFLVGAGAEQFALAQGFVPESDVTSIPPAPTHESHDTVCVLARDTYGTIAVATSTSGLDGKLPGRVGDTPVIGSGFYADNLTGAAACTGVGESIMRGCLAIEALRLVQTGLHPTAACDRVIEDLVKRCQPITNLGAMSMICLDARGQWGAGTTLSEFPYAIAGDGIEPHILACATKL